MKKILIVDDEAPIRFAASLIVRRAGYEALEASNGCEALDIIKAGANNGSPVDLLLLDLNMPGRTGQELMTELMQVENSPQIVIITGTIDRAELERVGKHKCCGILSKPFRAEKLLQVIAEVFAGKKPVMR